MLYSNVELESEASTSGQFPPVHLIGVPGELKFAAQYAAEAYWLMSLKV